MHVVTITNKQDADVALYQAMFELPQPNCDTVAFFIFHLQCVSSMSECKMPISNLVKMFGPTLIGYSSQELPATAMLLEITTQAAILESLSKILSDYWTHFVNHKCISDIGTLRTGELEHMPSTESLLKRTAARGFFNTPQASSLTFLRKNRKYLATPPHYNGIQRIH